jgi:uncharacterized membrane protein YhiD involved in acid resistance
MDELLKQTQLLKDVTEIVTIQDAALALLLSFMLALIIAKIYQYTHKGVSYSQSYVYTLVIMTTVVSLIMLIIGSNIARAFSLVGALSIIRFRNAVKDSRDVAFVFLAMAVGMACGTRFYLMAIFATFMISSFILLLYKLNLFNKPMRERILMVQVHNDFDYQDHFEHIFKKYFLNYSLISIETLDNKDLIELIYSISLKSKFQTDHFLKEIREINENNKVSLIEGQQQIDL